MKLLKTADMRTIVILQEMFRLSLPTQNQSFAFVDRMLYERSLYDHNVRNLICERALKDHVRSNAIVHARTFIGRTSIEHTSAYTKHAQCTPLLV